jgi:hypothetical protein
MEDPEFPPLLKVTSGRQPWWRRVLLIGGALLLFALGIFGWLVPVVTGIPFYVAGLVLLGIASPSVRRWINRTEARLSPGWRKGIRDTVRKVPIRKVRDSVRPTKPSTRPSD